jgi:hypothetical protein
MNIRCAFAILSFFSVANCAFADGGADAIGEPRHRVADAVGLPNQQRQLAVAIASY